MMLIILTMMNNLFQAFIDAWEVACSFHSRSMLEIPEGKVYLIGPLDFGGPCRSKLTVSVCIHHDETDVSNYLNPILVPCYIVLITLMQLLVNKIISYDVKYSMLTGLWNYCCT